MENAFVIAFDPRPVGGLRLVINNAPPGTWEVTTQITTWPSPNFGEAEIKMLRFSKKLSVNTGATSIGYVDAWIGTPVSDEDYVDNENGDPTQVSGPRFDFILF